MKITSFASGSRANATLVESSGEAVLVDCGLSYRTLKRHLPARLSGILVTHSHTDHVSGLRTLLQHVDAPVFANALTAEATACGAPRAPSSVSSAVRRSSTNPSSVLRSAWPSDGASTVVERSAL